MSSAVTVSSSGVSAGVGVGGADVGEVAPGQDEQHPAVDRAGEDDRRRGGRAGSGPPRCGCPWWAEQRRRARRPPCTRTRSAQGPVAFTTTLARTVARSPVSRSSICAPTTRPAVRSSAAHRDVVGDQRAVVHRRAGGGQHQPGVVALRVVEAGAAQEPALPQHRLRLQHRTLAQHAVRLHIAEQREEVVQPHAGAPGARARSGRRGAAERRRAGARPGAARCGAGRGAPGWPRAPGARSPVSR